MRKVTNCPHTDRISKARGRCGSCYEKWYANTHPEYREKKLQYRRKYNQKNSAIRCKKQRAYALRAVYNIDETQHSALIKFQGNVCAICGVQEKSRALAIDHDHVSRKVRGLLCLRCNTKLGWYEDHIERIKQYLNRPPFEDAARMTNG